MTILSPSEIPYRVYSEHVVCKNINFGSKNDQMSKSSKIDRIYSLLYILKLKKIFHFFQEKDQLKTKWPRWKTNWPLQA